MPIRGYCCMRVEGFVSFAVLILLVAELMENGDSKRANEQTFI
jgi:hypothetical protein